MKDFRNVDPSQFENTGLGQMGTQAPADPLMQAFRAYAKARDEFHDSCHGLVAAHQRRQVAEQQLQKISEELNEAVRINLLDPTVPQPTPGTPPPNGAWQNSGGGAFQGGLIR